MYVGSRKNETLGEIGIHWLVTADAFPVTRPFSADARTSLFSDIVSSITMTERISVFAKAEEESCMTHAAD